MKKIVLTLLVLVALSSCKEEVPLTSSEMNFTSEEHAIIEVNIPKFDGNPEISEKINAFIGNYIINTLMSSIGEDEIDDKNLNEVVKKFNKEYLSSSLNEDKAPPWEAFIDGEIIYQSDDIISIAVLSSVYTGGAHGYSSVKFLNFQPSTGAVFETKDLISNIDKFTRLAETHFKKEIKGKSKTDEYSFGDEFVLPETIGFSEDGVIMLYNYRETGMLNKNTTEFTIPYEEVSDFLIVH